MFIWIYQNQEGDCLNDIGSGALVVSMDAQLSWVLHPIWLVGTPRVNGMSKFFLIRSSMAGTTGETLQLRRAEEGAVRPSFLGLFWRTGMLSPIFYQVRGKISFPNPIKYWDIEGRTGSSCLVSAARRAAARSLCQGCLHVVCASSFWMLLVGELQSFDSLAVGWLLQEADFPTGPSHSNTCAFSTPDGPSWHLSLILDMYIFGLVAPITPGPYSFSDQSLFCGR